MTLNDIENYFILEGEITEELLDSYVEKLIEGADKILEGKQ